MFEQAKLLMCTQLYLTNLLAAVLRDTSARFENERFPRRCTADYILPKI